MKRTKTFVQYAFYTKKKQLPHMATLYSTLQQKLGHQIPVVLGLALYEDPRDGSPGLKISVAHATVVIGPSRAGL